MPYLGFESSGSREKMSEKINDRYKKEKEKKEERSEERYRDLYHFLQRLEKYEERLEEQFTLLFEGSTDNDHSTSDSESEDGMSEKESTGAKPTLGESDRRLIDAYFNTTARSLHPRRTLDQSYYYMLDDIEKRDADQVVFRWAKKNGRN